MIETKEMIKSKAHTELNEVIKRLSKQELEKIPEQVIRNIHETMDKEYIWKYDDTKELEEQKLLVETKALIVEMYERYLCSEDKKEFWSNYDRVCLNMIEEKKKEEYNPDNIFKEKQYAQDRVENNNLPIETRRENFLKKIVDFIRSILKK